METFMIDGVRLVSPIKTYLGPVHWHPESLVNYEDHDNLMEVFIRTYGLDWVRVEVEQGRLRVFD